jgi:hypothetical protein
VESKSQSTPQPSLKVTAAIPRLISIVEIVKREFLKSLAAKHSPRLAGLHQYNELGCLEDLDTVEQRPETPQERAAAIAMALEGKIQ